MSTINVKTTDLCRFTLAKIRQSALQKRELSQKEMFGLLLDKQERTTEQLKQAQEILAKIDAYLESAPQPQDMSVRFPVLLYSSLRTVLGEATQ